MPLTQFSANFHCILTRPSLIGEAHVHHAGWMVLGIGQVDQPAFARQFVPVPIGEHVWLDGLAGSAHLIRSLNLYPQDRYQGRRQLVDLAQYPWQGGLVFHRFPEHRITTSSEMHLWRHVMDQKGERFADWRSTDHLIIVQHKDDRIAYRGAFVDQGVRTESRPVDWDERGVASALWPRSDANSCSAAMT